MTASNDPYLLTREEGQAVWFLGTLMLFKATGQSTAQTFSLIEQTLPPGFAPPLHVHHAEDEAFSILEGELTFVCGERRWQAGAFIFLPRDIAHGCDIYTLQALLGHEDIATIKEYMHLSNTAVQEQKRKFSPANHGAVEPGPGGRKPRQRSHESARSKQWVGRGRKPRAASV